jgi:hypothetical protein
MSTNMYNLLTIRHHVLGQTQIYGIRLVVGSDTPPTISQECFVSEGLEQVLNHGLRMGEVIL